jgi:hypothetical protein
MARNATTRASDILFDGIVPPFAYQSGLISHAASQANGAAFIAPCALYIERVDYVVAVLASHADAQFDIGTVADEDAYINAVDVTDVVAGTYELDMASANVITRVIPKGALVRTSTGAGSAVGSIAVSMVLVPYVQRA